MKRLAIALTLTALLTACGTDDGIDGRNPSEVRPLTPTTRVIVTDPPLNDLIERVTIDGMPCLVWKDKVNAHEHSAYAYSGLTCDWSAR